jgi:hypothetical protein
MAARVVIVVVVNYAAPKSGTIGDATGVLALKDMTQIVPVKLKLRK